MAKKKQEDENPKPKDTKELLNGGLEKMFNGIKKSGVEKIFDERQKQITKYGYTPASDAQWKNLELLQAALTYIVAAMNNGLTDVNLWPFEPMYYHYEGYEESLKKAGAFIAAELDRIQLN